MLSLYKSSGLVVHSHPVEDPAHAAGCERTGIEQLETLKPTTLSLFALSLRSANLFRFFDPKRESIIPRATPPFPSLHKSGSL